MLRLGDLIRTLAPQAVPADPVSRTPRHGDGGAVEKVGSNNGRPLHGKPRVDPMSGPVLHPPTGGQPAPETAILRDGRSVDLVPLAHEICRRFQGEYTDEQSRYGDAGQA